jgi:hypothetical protein
VDHHSVDTQQTQEQIGTTNCGKSCSCPWQPRSEEDQDGKTEVGNLAGRRACLTTCVCGDGREWKKTSLPISFIEF